MSKHNNTLIELIKSLESDKQNTANMVRLGMHYLEIVKTPTRYQYLIAASLLQISSEREGEHLENGEYWLALATAHFKIWLFDGILANEERLNLASSACQHAAKFVSEENLITLWETMASIFLYSGKLNHADDVLESMVVKFPDHPNLSSIYMFIAQVKGGLQKYDDAADLLKYVLNNPCHPYSEADVLILLGMTYEKCSVDDADDFEAEDFVDQEKHELLMAKRANNRYEQAFTVARLTGKVGENCTSSEIWLNTWEVWIELAEQCSAAGHFLYSVDCYTNGIERCRSTEELPELWFKLAKAKFRSGSSENALVAAKHAYSLEDRGGDEMIGEIADNERNKKIEVAINHWGSGTSGDKILKDVNEVLILQHEVEDFNLSGDEGTIRDGPVGEDSSLSPETETETEVGQNSESGERSGDSLLENTNRDDLMSPNTQLPMLGIGRSMFNYDDLNSMQTTNTTHTAKRSQSSRIATIVASQINKSREKNREKERRKQFEIMQMQEEELMKLREVEVVPEKIPIYKKKRAESEQRKIRIEAQHRHTKKIKNKLVLLKLQSKTDENKFNPSFESKYWLYRKASVERFKQLGYTSNQTLAYWNHWTTKVKDLQKTMLNQEELNYCVAEIRNFYPFVTKETVFVALAEARGSVEEACAKLSEDLFLQECSVICRVMNVAEFMQIDGGIGGGGGVFLEDSRTIALDEFSLEGGGSVMMGTGGGGSSVDEGELGLEYGDGESTMDLGMIQLQSSVLTKTRVEQRNYMATLASPDASKSPIDIMVEQHQRRNFISPNHTVRLGSIINSGSGEWGAQKGGRIAGGKGGGSRRRKKKCVY